jgi:glycosyltransferase involved in cell wall biosynthesis
MISLVLASKNEEKHINTFFESIRKQTRKPDEIILVDSSTDRTAEIAKHFVDKLIKTQTKCAGHARSIGVKASKGDIIIFTDLDAIPHPDWLKELVKPFESPDVNVVQGQVFLKNYDGRGEKWLFTTGLKKWGKYLNHCNTAYRKKVLKEIPLDPEQFWDDAEMSYRISKKYLIYGNKKAKVYHYTVDYDKQRHLWGSSVYLGIGWMKILKKYKNLYWILRIEYNLYKTLKELGIKEFVYFSAGLFYAFYLEVIRNKEVKNLGKHKS